MQSTNVKFRRSEDNIAMSKASDLTCTAVSSDTGTVCGERSGLQILDEFRKLYEDRIRNVDLTDDDDDGDNRAEAKMKIMMEWIQDLDAQNTMLVRTVEELEEAACCRVKMLEEKLKHTSCVLSESMSRHMKPEEETLNELSQRINRLERNEDKLKQNVHYLESDIKSLLELIRRAQKENSWSLDGIRFCLIRPSDIPMPDDSTYGKAMGDSKNVESLMHQLQLLRDNEKKSKEYQQDLQQEIERLNRKLVMKEKTTKKLFDTFETLKDSIKHRSEANADITNDMKITQIVQILDTVESELTVRKTEEDVQEESSLSQEDTVHFDDNVEAYKLRNEVEEKTREIARLTHQLNCLEKESIESREALTLEVAEKHDMAMRLKERVVNLDEQLRRYNMQVHFKDDIIKEMRKEIKRVKAKGTTSHSPRKSRVNTHDVSQKVSWSDDGSDEVPVNHIETQHNSLLSNIENVKSTSHKENLCMVDIKKELILLLNDINSQEKETFDRSMKSADAKLKDMRAMMDNYEDEVLKPVESEDSKGNGVISNTDRLTRVIATLSELCIEKSKGIIQLEFALQNVHEKNDRIRDLEAAEKISHVPEINRQQFNAMEEFRICTVEAQAATEDLREEMEAVICNLQCRHQLFNELNKSMEKMLDVVGKTKQNLPAVIKSTKAQIEEKVVTTKTIHSGQVKLKNMKNEINEARAKMTASSSTIEAKQSENLTLNEKIDVCSRLLDNVLGEMDNLVCNLGVFIIKEDYGLTLFTELHGQIDQIERNLEDMQKHTDRVLQDNGTAQKVFDDKAKKLDKLERELDYAHTKMQDTLENIVFMNRQSESSNGPSSRTVDTSSFLNDDEENSRRISDVDVEQLRTALGSKDKLLEHKDEIIRIQKDSIKMTQGELKDLHQRLQSKSSLQSQTIGHLQDAIVEAKKSLYRQQPQKSVGDVWSPITPTVFNNEDVHDV